MTHAFATRSSSDRRELGPERAGRLPRLCRAGGRRGPGAGRRGRRAADDPAQREGFGIPAGVPGGDGGRAVSQCALGGRERAAGGGAPADRKSVGEGTGGSVRGGLGGRRLFKKKKKQRSWTR